MAFVAALKNYFGLKPGETLQEFLAELKALTDADKSELHRLLIGAGVQCDPPTVAKAA